MELKTNNIIYYVETLEDLFDLAERLDKLGCRWGNGDRLTNKEYLTRAFKDIQDLCLYEKYGKVSCAKKLLYEKLYPHIPIATYRREQVDVPTYEVKKAIVPQFVADYIVESKNKGCTLKQSMYYEVKHDVFLYFTNNSETYARAWLDGYEVEKEQLYTVEIPNPNIIGNEVNVLMKNGFKQVVIVKKFGKDWKTEKGFRLTESEIKRDFEWAWQFAEEVE